MLKEEYALQSTETQSYKSKTISQVISERKMDISFRLTEVEMYCFN